MNDEEIIGLFFQRDQSAVSQLRLKYEALCRSVIKNILPDRRDVEECLSDTYLRTWNSIPPEKPDSLRAYISRIARNCALDKHSYNTAAQRSSALTTAFEELETFLSLSCTGPEQYAEEAELRDFINKFLRSRSSESRRFFLLRYWYGESIAEIAEKCGVSQPKVKTSLFRTRQQLHQALEKERIFI